MEAKESAGSGCMRVCRATAREAPPHHSGIAGGGCKARDGGVWEVPAARQVLLQRRMHLRQAPQPQQRHALRRQLRQHVVHRAAAHTSGGSPNLWRQSGRSATPFLHPRSSCCVCLRMRSRVGHAPPLAAG